MKRLVLFAAVCGVLLSSTVAMGAAKPTVTLQFFDVQTSFNATITTQVPKLNDRFVFRDSIYKWSGSKPGARVGYADVTGAFLSPNLTEIFATAHLPGGTLDIAGISNGNSRVQKFGVVGGTGIYATARGELSVRTLGGQNSNKSAITIRLWT